LKILHVTYAFPPEPPGGTDLYVQSLCTYLTRLGVTTVIAAPGSHEHPYSVGGLRGRSFHQHDGSNPEDLYDGNSRSLAAFARILDEEGPDVVHLHVLTSACPPQLLAEAKRRNIATVFTLHTPTVTCQRGTLLHLGKEPCTERVDVNTCTSCALDALGLPQVAARALGAVPPAAGELLGKCGLRGDRWTTLRMSNLVHRRQVTLASFFQDVDRFVALSPWVENVLRVNGVPESKIVRSAHGVRLSVSRRAVWPRAFDHRLRLVHFGRVDATKGLAVLIAAVRALPDLPLELDLFAVVLDRAGQSVLEQLQSAAAGDARIRFLPPLHNDEVLVRVADYHMVVVPSQWMETGPLTVLEAFAAGVPVLGSDLGGIAEKVTDGVNGLLVRPFDSVAAWSATLKRAVQDSALLPALQRGVRPPRPALAVAEDMRGLYASLVAPVRRPSPVPNNRAAVVHNRPAETWPS
jgi:glycosyltransferase involved in cell wall biosynthesis